MGTTGIQIVIILAYISVLFGISWYVKRRAASSTEDYVLAGRRLTTPLIMVSIVGLAVGGASTIGVAEQAYKVGLSAGWYTAAWGIGAIVMGLTVAKKYRRLHITTVPELLERYYDRRSMVAGIACQVLVQLVVMSLQYVAGGAVLAASCRISSHRLRGCSPVPSYSSGLPSSAACGRPVSPISSM